jgi:hypothetical protein
VVRTSDGVEGLGPRRASSVRLSSRAEEPATPDTASRTLHRRLRPMSLAVGRCVLVALFRSPGAGRHSRVCAAQLWSWPPEYAQRMLVCQACGGRNVANVAVCTFCQHPFGPYHHRPFWRGRRVLLVLLWLLLIGMLSLALASRATPLPISVWPTSRTQPVLPGSS